MAYIERKERQIDTYIARQAEQIERLKELRKTIISHAVTRGIHPYTRFRPTGIPWIPEVPEHWEVGLGKRIYSTNDSGVWGSEPTGENDTIVLRSTEQDIEGKLQIISPASRHLSKDEIKQALLLEGDLIITKSSGSSAHIGKTSIIDEPTSSLRCCFSNFLQRIRIKGCPKCYWYIFNSNIVREQFQQMFSTTTGLRNLSASIIGNIFLPLPPLSEQHAIVAYIEKKTAAVDRMINACREQTELMKA